MAPFGSNLLVGAYASGRAYLIDPSTGGVVREFFSPLPAARDFGYSVAPAGSHVLVGDPRDSTRAEQSGAAVLLDAATGAAVTTFFDPSLAPFNRFGDAVLAVGPHVVVGATGDDTAGEERGAVHVFDRATGTLVQTIVAPPGSTFAFGQSLEEVGNGFAVGSFSASSAFVYRACECDDGNLVDGDGCDNNCTVTRCGNGVLTAGEQCDDGNTVAGDCCGATCQTEVAGAACSDDGNACTDDACDGAGTCTHPGRPAGSPCASDGIDCTLDQCDGSGFCAHAPFACGVCLGCGPAGECVPALAAGCQPPGGGRLWVTNERIDPSDRFVWEWRSSATTSAADFGEPRVDTSYDLCVYDAAGRVLGTTLPAGGVCPGRLCWNASGQNLRYLDRAGSHAGVEDVKLRPGGAGKGRISIRGRGAGLGLPAALALAPPLRVQLRRADGAACWESTLSQPSRNDAGAFRARPD
jgi:cysteine-rich repeat protein